MPVSKLLYVAVILLVIIVADVIAKWVQYFIHSQKLSKLGSSSDGQQQCKQCSSIDPVSDPAYNMKEIAKQSVLLEEHLTVPNKFCPDCCVKHLLHMHGLAIEAVMLACKDVDKYPYMKEAPDFYQQCLDDWENKVKMADFRENPQPRLELATKLRNFRKKLISAYYNQT